MKSLTKTPGRLGALAVAVLVSLFSMTGRAAVNDEIPPEQNRELNDSVNRAVATVMAANIDEVLTNLVKAKVPLDRSEVGRYVAEYLSNKDLGFTRGEAAVYVDQIVYSARPNVPDTLSIAGEQAYLDKMAAQSGAIKMPSGLVFIVITEGEGTTPTVKDRVQVHYVAKLSDGTVFDDTEGEVIAFDVAGVIPGFAEGLQQMKPGGTYRVVIPAALGYGPQGIPGIIPGNAALDFTVTLDGVVSPESGK